MPRPQIPNATARALFLDRHGLATPRAPLGRGAALTALIERLGFVQVDSVNTLARAHDLILFARAGDYRPQSLRWLNDRARGTFEGWTHDASVIPMTAFPHWRLKFARDAQRLDKRWPRFHGAEFRDETDRLIRHITETGPCSSREMAAAHEGKRGGWWDWHPSKTALEYLWRTGRLAVTRREGFAKRYDLLERVVPDDLRTTQH
ncbi:MAG: crosslink repair DNA glycosylase YcaQ family protein, partial [Pseudomonadota bacterium]